MAFIKRKAKEYGQLCLLFLGFLTGIGLVVTCGGGGGSGQQLPTSTSGTISFAPLNVDGAGTLMTNGPIGGPPGMVDVNVPPALRGITNVQDALNRLNVILSPVLARVTDPLTPFANQVSDANLPAFLKDSVTGEPLTFSRALSGLVRASSLSGVVRADDAFLLTCREAGPTETTTSVPYVQRSFCRETFVGGVPTSGFGVIEIFDRDSIDNVVAITDYDNNLPNAMTRMRLDGGDPVTGAPRITLFDGTVNAEVPAIILDGATGTIDANDGAGNPTVTISGATGNITANNNVSASNDVSAANDMTAGGSGTFGTGANIVALNNAATGNVDATGAVNAGTNVSAGADVVATGNVIAGLDVSANGVGTFGTGANTVALNSAASGDVTATGDVNAGGNVAATANVTAGGNMTATGSGSFGTGLNTVTINNGGTGSLAATGSATFGGSGAFLGNGIFGSGGNTVTLNGAGLGEFAATGNGTFGGNLGVTGDITGTNVIATNSLSTNANFLAGGNIEVGVVGGIAGTGTVLLSGAGGSGTFNGSVLAGSGTGNEVNLDATSGNATASGNVEAGATAGVAGTGTVLLDGATGDLTANGTIVSGNGTANTVTMDAVTGDVTAATGNFLAPLGDVLAGADPSAGNVGINLSGTTGTMTINSAAVGARVIGNGGAGVPNILDIFDQSISTTPTHRLIAAGEKAGAAPDGTGYLSVFDSAQVEQIILDSETATASMGVGAAAITLNGSASTASFGTGANGITLDGSGGTVVVGSGANAISLNAVSGASSFGAGAMAISLDTTAGTFTVGGGVNATLVNGSTGVVTVGSGATGITLNGATGDISTLNLASTGDVTAGSGGATSVVLDAATGSVTADGNVVAGNGGNAVTLDSATGGVTAPGDITAGSGGNTVILDAATGGVTAVGDVSGNNVAATLDVTAGNDISAGNNVDAAVNVTAAADVIAANDLVSTDGRVVVQTPGAAAEVVIGAADGSGHGTMSVFDVTGVKPLMTVARDPGSGVGMDDGILEVYQDGASTIQLTGSTGDVAGVTKSFVQPHPTDPNLMIKYACLEGDENGLYARGTAKLENGFARVKLPESFVLAAAKKGLSVHLTPMGDCAGLYAPVAELTREGFVVRELFSGRNTIQFSWNVNGVRRGMEEYKAIVPNTAFRPTTRDQEFLPGRPGLQAIMIKSGLLNSDGTPNAQVAADAGRPVKTMEEKKRERADARANRKK